MCIRDSFGGTYATQENFRLMRSALDEVGARLGRYIRLTNYCSGLCMPEIAAMGALEKAGQPAVTAVVAALNDSSAVVRTNAAEMLGWLKPPSAVADLARLLADPDPAVQAQAAWALGEINTEPARLALNPAPAALLVAPVPPAAVVMPADAWTLAAMVALLLLGLLAIVLIWKGPRPTSHLGHT